MSMVRLKPEWLDVGVELFKAVHGYEMAGVNKDVGSLDYVVEDEEGVKKLLMVLVDSKYKASRCDIRKLDKTLEFLEDEDFDEITLVGQDFTSVTESRINRDDSLDYVSEESEVFSIMELLSAVQMLTKELCVDKCGKYPMSSEECTGYEDGKYTCGIRRVSDDSDFHAKMGWSQLLYRDFTNLVQYKRKLMNSKNAKS